MCVRGSSRAYGVRLHFGIGQCEKRQRPLFGRGLAGRIRRSIGGGRGLGLRRHTGQRAGRHAILQIEHTQRRIFSADDDCRARLDRAPGGAERQRTHPLLTARHAVHRTKHVVEGDEVHVSIVGDRLPDDVAACPPAPVDLTVVRHHAVEPIVLRSGVEAIFKSQDLVRCAAEPALPSHIAAGDAERDDAVIGGRHVHAVAGECRRGMRGRFEVAAPDLLSVDGP